MLAAVLLLSACGGSGSTPQATLSRYLAAWGSGDWTAMRAQVFDPPAGFGSVNAAAFSALGVSLGVVHGGSCDDGEIRDHGEREHHRTLHAAQGRRLEPDEHRAAGQAKEHVAPGVVPGDDQPVAAGGSEAGGAQSLAGARRDPRSGRRAPDREPHHVIVGVVGSRVKQAAAVETDLLDAGASRAEATQALAQARAHPTFFEPVFTVTRARFAQLKAMPGPTNVYAVPGTVFQLSTSRSGDHAAAGRPSGRLGRPDHRSGAAIARRAV